MEDQATYNRARERVEAKLGVYTHLAVYVIVGALLIIVDIKTSAEYTWAQWPLIGWGIGLLFHALGVFVFRGRSALTERMIEKELGKGPRKDP